ncbi:hypothetical protein SLE2022_225720 [Rubroshorea leprosula]
MMSAMVDPHDKMRSRDMNKVARGEQAPKPTHEFGTVSPPPQNYKPKSSSPSSPPLNKEIGDNNTKVEDPQTKPQTRHCCASYVEYHKCVKEKGNNAPGCEMFAKHYKSLCPNEWIDRWDRERELGTFPAL